MIKFDFSGQTAIVTGGTRGIGAAVSAAFLQAGAQVLATYAGNQSAAEQFAQSQGKL
ncbi:MAG: SDR family NAD(P)-dependent oxidoreductase, partial [Lentisphaeria bacterium]|nr:SDR family NAD(P)-dependent oxidoreductase [Lentisphaeria bacterium]